MQQLLIDEGRTPFGVRILRVSLPLGEGRPAYEWDGTAAAADDIIDSMACVAGETIVDDRATMGLTTGWRPEFDEHLWLRPRGSEPDVETG